MVSFVAVMQNGATVETATIGHAGVIGAGAGLGARLTIARALVQLPGTAAWISASQFQAAAAQSQALRDLIVRYNDLLLAQVQQSVACNALHGLEARLCLGCCKRMIASTAILSRRRRSFSDRCSACGAPR